MQLQSACASNSNWLDNLRGKVNFSYGLTSLTMEHWQTCFQSIKVYLYINTTLTPQTLFSHWGKCLVRLHKSENEILNQLSTPHESNLNTLSPPPLVIFRHAAVSIPFPSGAPLVWSVTNVHHSPLALHTHCRMEGCREEIERLKLWPLLLTFHFFNLFPPPVH